MGRIVFESEDVQAEDLQTAPNPDGSDFLPKQLIPSGPALVRLDINVYGKAVASLNPVIRLYRKESAFNNYYCKGESFTLDTAITNTTTGEYRALTSIEVGGHDLAIVLEDAEVGSTLKIAVSRESNGSV